MISEDDIEGDLFDLCRGPSVQRTPGERTVYKNAGGAHQDLIVSQLVVALLNERRKRD